MLYLQGCRGVKTIHQGGHAVHGFKWFLLIRNIAVYTYIPLCVGGGCVMFIYM